MSNKVLVLATDTVTENRIIPLAQPYSELFVFYQLKVMAYPKPPNLISEVLDFYDTDLNEIFDIYLTQQGQLGVFMNHGNFYSESPIPLNQWVNVWEHYKQGGSVPQSDANSSYGSVGWSLDLDEVMEGKQFVSWNQGFYNSPVVKLFPGYATTELAIRYLKASVSQIGNPLSSVYNTIL